MCIMMAHARTEIAVQEAERNWGIWSTLARMHHLTSVGFSLRNGRAARGPVQGKILRLSD